MSKGCKAYLSGPITGTGDYKKRFLHYGAMIANNFPTSSVSCVKNPIDFKPLFGWPLWWCYMVTCIWHLSWCKKAFFMPGWEQSKGARIERYFARVFKIDCYQINPAPTALKNRQKVDEDNYHWQVIERNPVTGVYCIVAASRKYILISKPKVC